MDMFDPEAERDLFSNETAGIDLRPIAAEAYARMRLFEFDALGLLSSRFDAEIAQWFEVAGRAAQGPIAEPDLMMARNRIVEYRSTHLGLDDIGQYATGETDALTRLFLFALETWPAEHTKMMPSGVGQTIDVFSDLFAEHFGRGLELAELAKRRFAP